MKAYSALCYIRVITKNDIFANYYVKTSCSFEENFYTAPTIIELCFIG